MVKIFKRPQTRIPMSCDNLLLQLLITLRFGPSPQKASPILSYASISRLTGISAQQIKVLLAKSLPQMSIREPQSFHRWRTLTQVHISFLVSESTIFNWAPYTLAQRAVLFHRRFPEARASPSTIRRVYQHYCIKHKVIRRGKKIIDLTIEPYKGLLRELMGKMDSIIKEGVPIVFADEVVFTFNTFQARAWSQKGQNIQFEERLTSLKTQAAVAGYSLDKGLEALLINSSSINSTLFIRFLEILSDAHEGRKVALFIDNLKVHKAQIVYRAYQRLNIEPIFNIPYSPQYNGIESIFSIVKNRYKQLLVEALVNGKYIRVTSMIRDAFQQVGKDKSSNCLRHGMKELVKVHKDEQSFQLSQL